MDAATVKDQRIHLGLWLFYGSSTLYSVYEQTMYLCYVKSECYLFVVYVFVDVFMLNVGCMNCVI